MSDHTCTETDQQAAHSLATHRRVISSGPHWEVTREGSEEFVNFPGSFAEYVVKQLDETEESEKP